MTWINLDAVFPVRRAVLVARRRSLLTEPALGDFLAGRDPATFEAIWRCVVLAARPALQAFTLLSVGYNAALDAFEIHVAHPSLDPVDNGEPAPRMPLLPEGCPNAPANGD